MGLFMKRSRKSHRSASFIDSRSLRISLLDIRLPPVHPIATLEGREPAIVEFAKVLSDSRQLRPISDFPYAVNVRISHTLNAVVINAKG